MKDSSTASERVSFIKFLLSLFIIGDTSLITRTLSFKRLFGPVFRHLPKDDSDTIEMFLSMINEKVVVNHSIAKTVKVEFFNKFVLEDMSNLLVQPNLQAEGISELAMNMLLSLCTDSKIGICFLSNSFLDNPDWTNNPSILSLLTNLLPHLHLNVRHLVIKIISSLPDLLVLFLKRAAFSYDYKSNPNIQSTMEFIIQLFASLPSIVDMLNQCKMKNVNKSNMWSCINYCMPIGLNRSNLSVLLLNPDIEMKRSSLFLVRTILERVLDAVSVLSKGKKFHSSFIDTVLKQLPDAQTLINVKQQLVLGGEETALNYQVISDLLHVLYLLQKLSPTILPQANLSMASLVKDMDASDGVYVRDQILSIIMEAPLDSLKGLVNADILSKMISLMLNYDKFPNKAASVLTKCSRMNPLLLDREDDVMLLLDLAYHENRDNDGDVDVTVLTGCLLKIYKFELGGRYCECADMMDLSALDSLSIDDVCAMEQDQISKLEVLNEVCSFCESAVLSPVGHCVILLIDKSISDENFRVYFQFLFKLIERSSNPTKQLSCFQRICSVAEAAILSEAMMENNVSSEILCLAQISNILLALSCKELTNEQMILLRKLCAAGQVESLDRFILFIKHFCRDLSPFSYATLVSYLMGELGNAVKQECSDNSEEKLLIECLMSVMKEWKVSPTEYTLLSSKWKKLVRRGLRERFRCHLFLTVIVELIRNLYCGRCEELYSLKSIYKIIWSNLSVEKSLSEIVQCKEREAAIVKLMGSVAVNLTDDLSAVNECFDSQHYQFFLGSYTASTSLLDKGLLFLMFLYERSGVSMAQFDPVCWGQESLKYYSGRQDVSWLLWKQPTSYEILNTFDRGVMKQSVENFPINRLLDPVDSWKPSVCSEGEQAVLYDPCFVLPRLSSLLDSSTDLDCRKFISSFCFSYLIASTSAIDECVRSAGYHCLERFDIHLQKAWFRGKRQLLMFMNVLRNSVVKENVRLPSVVSAFFTNSLPIITNQEHSLHSLIVSFISKKKFISLKDIPLYSTCLLSFGPQHMLERHWILQMLVRGLQCDADYYLYKKKEVLTQLLSLYHCPFTPKANKCLILQILTKAVSITPAARDLVWNHGLLPWIHDLQQKNENCEYVKNIMEVLNKTINIEHTSLVKIPFYDEELKFIKIS